LAAVAVSVVVAFNAVVLIWKLAWIDFLTIRGIFDFSTLRHFWAMPD